MTQSFLPPDFFQKMMEQAEQQAANFIEILANQIWSSYWRAILIFIAVIVITKILTGRIGSLIYNIIYFGILALIILIWGWEILFSIYFDAIYALFYPVSFYLTGLILRKIRNQ